MASTSAAATNEEENGALTSVTPDLVADCSSRSVISSPLVPVTRTVLLGVDTSERSQRIIRWFAQSAMYSTDRVIIGYIIVPPSMLVGHFTPLSTREPDYYTIEGGHEVATRLGESLAAFASSVGLHKVEFRGEFYGTDAANGLLRLANEVQASVIVLGSRGMGRMKKVILGSTTDYVLSHSMRPVLVCPPTTPHPAGT